MPTDHHHPEPHLHSSDSIRDVILGMADGLTVPFALAAGLAGAVAASHIIVAAGLAEIAAGSISMGLGGYLAARSEAEHYVNERKREVDEVERVPETEAQEVAHVLTTYGLNHDEAKIVVDGLRRKPEAWVDFMMRFELGLEEPHPQRALVSAATIAAAYIVGGSIPLAPYLFTSNAHEGLLFSIGFTLLALILFGYLKGKATGSPALRSSLQTVLVGGAAGGLAYWLAGLVA
ncbi:MAG: VIT1/CCC1 transporter family protein [bacterium]